MDQPPKQQWWEQGSLDDLETLLENKLQKYPRTELAAREKRLFFFETLRQWLSKSPMVLYFLLKQINDDELRISHRWEKKKTKAKKLKNKAPRSDTCAKHFCLQGDWYCLFQTIPQTRQNANSRCTGRSVQESSVQAVEPTGVMSTLHAQLHPGLPFCLHRHLYPYLSTLN